MTTLLPTVTQQRAQQIMGRNYHGPNQVARHFRVRFSRNELATLTEVPFSEDVLESSKNTHALVAGYPLSILEMKKRFKRHFCFEARWYDDEAFAKDTKLDRRWYLVRNDAVENSFFKTWAEQQKLLTEGEVVPKACVMVYTIILHFLAAHEWLFDETFVRCQDVTRDNYRVIVGVFKAHGLNLNCSQDDTRDNDLGLPATHLSGRST